MGAPVGSLMGPLVGRISLSPALFRKFEKGGGVRDWGVVQICRKARADLSKIMCISFRTSEEGCAKLSQICRKLENLIVFVQFYANAPFQRPLLCISEILLGGKRMSNDQDGKGSKRFSHKRSAHFGPFSEVFSTF